MTRPAAAPFPQMLLAQTKSELLMRWRVPAFSVTNLALPIVFFTFFGLPVAHVVRGDGVSIGAYLLASFGAYAVGNVMVYGFGIGVANERGMKVDRLMRASPLPPLVFMLAKVVTALVFAFLALVLLIGFGIVAGGIHQTPAVWATIIARLLAGSLPFIALGGLDARANARIGTLSGGERQRLYSAGVERPRRRARIPRREPAVARGLHRALPDARRPGLPSRGAREVRVTR